MSAPTVLEVNGMQYTVRAGPERRLLDILRDEIGLTGTKYGCGEGQCGACTVLIDGSPRRSCQMLLSSAASNKITTIEGLEKDGTLHPIQQAFLDAGAFQCAYCTSGMIMSSVALLEKFPNPSPAQITQFMQGNICRCGTYSRIAEAIQRAAKSMQGTGQ